MQLIVAFIIVELSVRKREAILTTHSLRPLLLAACVIARKLLSDTKFTLGWACDQICDVLTGLHVELLAALELQLLLVIDWRFPMKGESYQIYADALFNVASAQSSTHIPPPLMAPTYESETETDSESHESLMETE